MEKNNLTKAIYVIQLYIRSIVQDIYERDRLELVKKQAIKTHERCVF